MQVDYTIAAAKAFLSALAPQTAARGAKFRFVFCSGQFAEWDQSKKLMFLGDTRRLKASHRPIPLRRPGCSVPP